MHPCRDYIYGYIAVLKVDCMWLGLGEVESVSQVIQTSRHPPTLTYYIIIIVLWMDCFEREFISPG